ncbi:hypothetical protein O988_09499, partial [Pseudogymnoascus sp. VKM F-3808]
SLSPKLFAWETGIRALKEKTPGYTGRLQSGFKLDQGDFGAYKRTQKGMSKVLFGPVLPPIPYGRKPSGPPRRPSLADTAEIMSVNAVYYPNYCVYRGETPSTLNYKCISHVYYAYAHVNADGFVFLSDELADGTMEVDGAGPVRVRVFGSCHRRHREETTLPNRPICSFERRGSMG